METKWYKSKTINFNAIFLAAVAVVTEGFGVVLDPTIIAGAQTIMNLILRRLTNTPIG